MDSVFGIRNAKILVIANLATGRSTVSAKISTLDQETMRNVNVVKV